MSSEATAGGLPSLGELDDAPERTAPAPTTPAIGRLGAFLAFGETKVGSAILTLFLTGVVGALLTNHFSNVQKDRERAIAASERSAAKRREYIDFAGKIIANRRVAVSLLHSALIRPTFPDELQRRWRAYQDAYLAYNQSAFEAHVDLSGLGREFTTNSFGAVLDRDITASFTRLDRCVTAAVDDRALTAAKTQRDLAVAGSRAASNDFSHCGKTKAGNWWSYSDEVGKLDGCISNFRTQLEWAGQTTDRAFAQKTWRGRLALAVRHFGHWVGRGFGTKPPDEGMKGDWIEGERGFWADLPGTLRKTCGSLVETNYQPAAPT